MMLETIGIIALLAFIVWDAFLIFRQPGNVYFDEEEE